MTGIGKEIRGFKGSSDSSNCHKLTVLFSA